METIPTVEKYIASQPADLQERLIALRKFIRNLVPEAGEKMAYGIPTFTLRGNLVHFAAYRSHIGFYPGSEAVEHFMPELGSYQTSKGTIQFPLDNPLPYDLIERIVRFRVEKSLGRKK